MSIAPELKKILFTIGDLSHNDTNVSLIDSAILRETKLPRFEINRVLTELSTLGLIKILPRPSGVDFKLVNITREGLKELTS